MCLARADEPSNRKVQAAILEGDAPTAPTIAAHAFLEGSSKSIDGPQARRVAVIVCDDHLPSSEVIRGHCMQSEVIVCDDHLPSSRRSSRPSLAIRCLQRSSEVIRGHPSSSELIRGHYRRVERSKVEHDHRRRVQPPLRLHDQRQAREAVLLGHLMREAIQSH